MSIPKEPRQLMINLMYLVLTAMLALNVSAEVINAFFKIDKGLIKNNEIVMSANKGVIEGMEKAVEKRPDDKPLVQFAKDAQVITEEFYTYVGGLKSGLEEIAGGLFYKPGEKGTALGEETDDATKWGKPVKYKDKEIPHRYFVDGNSGTVGSEKAYPANGPLLKAKVLETRAKLEALLKKAGASNKTITPKEIEDLISKLPLAIDEDAPKSAGKSWEDYNFGHMPVAAVYPMITKYQNDAKNAESAIINFLAKKIGGTVIEFDQFQPVAAAEKGYVISGEQFKANIFLSASSKQAKYSVRVNGSSLAVKDGVASYSTTTGSTGEQSYKVDISLTNPFTNKTDNFSETFKYEVGRRSVTVSADKMNVFYIGVDNPVSVVAAGVSSNQMKVSCSGSGCNLTGSNGKYNVTVSSQGTATITVSGGGLQATSFPYRAKRIPDPIAIVGGGPTRRGGAMPAGSWKGQLGVGAVLENFDFDATCQIQSYELTRQGQREDPVTERSSSPKFAGRVATLVSMAKAGDTFYIDDIKARCPGDSAGREIGSLVFKIK